MAEPNFDVLFLGAGDTARSILASAFVTAARYVRNRIAAFVSLPIRSLDAMSLNVELRNIGDLEGSSKLRRKDA